jgi:flavin reductase (NADH)/flavin reductase/chlorophenol-4-monooxygenase component 1
METAQCIDVAEVNPAEFRDALANALTPVTVVATDGDSGIAGVTCSAVCSVCDTPPTILVCINRRSFSNPVIKANGVLCVNWLQADHAHVSQMFAGAGAVPMHERFDDARWSTLATGAPHLRDAIVALDCRVVEAMEIGTHSVFLARVVATAKAHEGTALGYVRRCYAAAQPSLAALA